MKGPGITPRITKVNEKKKKGVGNRKATKGAYCGHIRRAKT